MDINKYMYTQHSNILPIILIIMSSLIIVVLIVGAISYFNEFNEVKIKVKESIILSVIILVVTAILTLSILSIQSNNKYNHKQCAEFVKDVEKYYGVTISTNKIDDILYPRLVESSDYYSENEPRKLIVLDVNDPDKIRTIYIDVYNNTLRAYTYDSVNKTYTKIEQVK